MHSLALKIGTASVFYRDPYALGGNEDCWERLPNEAQEEEDFA